MSNLRTLEDLRGSEPPQFFDTDQVAIKARLVAKFEADTDKTLFEGQPEMFMIETMAYALSIRSEGEQNAVLQNTIAWSQGRHVEDLATNVSIYRLLPQSAVTTLKFTLENAAGTDTNIAAGVRMSGAGQTFALDADVIIEAGALEASGLARAVEAGALANDLQPFVINVPVDILPSGVTGYNTTVTSAGSDIEDIERFRGRAANGNFRITKAGTRNGYRERVKGVNPEISDVGVVRPQPGYIDIYPLMTTGLPSAEIKSLVLAVLDPEDDVPMGDFVTIKDPIPVSFDFTVIVRIDAADTSMEATAQAKVEAIFKSWSTAMGVRVSPSVIISEIRTLAGVIDVEVTGLDYTDLDATEFAVLGVLTPDVQVTPDV